MCTLSAQSSICILSNLCHAQEPSECAVLYRLKHSGRAALSCCKGIGLGWWAIQLPAVRAIVGSTLFRDFEQQVSMKCLADQSRLEA